MFLLIILFFILGAYIGSHSSKKRLRELYDENANLRATLYNHSGQVPAQTVASGAVAPTAVPASVPISQNTAIETGEVPPPSSKPIDNATILLYLGAFLFTAAVGLFIAFAGVGGTARTVLTALVAGGFYGLGIYLFRRVRRLKPAGLSFIAIGMILVPFVGFAAYVFMLNRTNPEVVWCITSVIALLLYIHALLRTRHTFSVYFLLAAFLSLFMSGVAVVELPVYYFGIVMSLAGTLFMLIPKFWNVPDESRGPLEFASTILIPFSLMFALISIERFGFLQASVAFGLAAAFYSVLSYVDPDNSARGWFMIFGNVSATIAASLMTWDITRNAHAIGIVLSIIALVQTGVLYYLRVSGKRTKEALSNIDTALYVIIQASILLTTLIFIDRAAFLCVALFLLVLHQLLIYRLTRQTINALVAAVAYLSLPVVVGVYWLDPAMQAAQLALLYLGIASLAFGVRMELQNKFLVQTSQAAYTIGLAVAYALALNGGRFYAALMSACFALIVCGLGRYEKVRELWAVAGVLVFVSAGTFLGLTHVNFSFASPSIFGLLAIVIYGIAYQLKKIEYFSQWQEVAIFGAAAGATSVVIFGTTTIPMIIDLALVAGLLYLYAKEKKNIASQYAAGIIGMAAFQWLIGYYGERHVLVYSHLWAALFGIYAYIGAYRHQKSEEQPYTILALTVLTAPTALMALDNAGGGYGWLLILEQIGLVLLGMAVGKKTITKWGLIGAILAVLYQLRNLTFIALALVGLTIIGIAIYLLLKRGNEEKPSSPSAR